ncbi:F-box protein At5g07610-like [Impatiens glandulifera]|uniref:F-box protein At5g07610-like n=1 Tax=Impatiens glandulifera TaxID=253017 RepID=UPI001FB07EE8|nr:F-box protein At5g07610-like [Impatiens glandulifera]
MSSSSSSSDKVGSNEDLLLQILLRLPIKSLLRFKSVSKQWLSLISDPRFARRWRPTSSPPSGLFYHWFSTAYVCDLPHIDFIPLDNNNINMMNFSSSSSSTTTTYPPNLEFFPYLYDITFMNSNNGLICCVVHRRLNPRASYYHVINPSTRQFTTLPQPSLSNLHLDGLTMAFDPSKSPHYKLVSVRSKIDEEYCSAPPTHYQLEIYSSETRSWNASIVTITVPKRHIISFHRGVNWNGAIVWFAVSGESLFFQVDEERIGTIPELTFEEGFWYNRVFCVGESNGHLYLVETYKATTKVKVYEMESDFSSGWVMKYNIDLFEVGKAFPLMLKRLPGRTNSPYTFDVISLVWRDEKLISKTTTSPAPFLVVSIPGKMIRFNLEEEESFMEICDVDIKYYERDERSHHYIESLFTTSP